MAHVPAESKTFGSWFLPEIDSSVLPAIGCFVQRSSVGNVPPNNADLFWDPNWYSPLSIKTNHMNAPLSVTPDNLQTLESNGNIVFHTRNQSVMDSGMGKLSISSVHQEVVPQSQKVHFELYFSTDDTPFASESSSNLQSTSGYYSDSHSPWTQSSSFGDTSFFPESISNVLSAKNYSSGTSQPWPQSSSYGDTSFSPESSSNVLSATNYSLASFFPWMQSSS